MGTIVVLLLLGWLACTALLTIGVGGSRDPRTRSDKVVRQGTMTSGDQNVSPPAMAIGPAQEASGSPAGVD